MGISQYIEGHLIIRNLFKSIQFSRVVFVNTSVPNSICWTKTSNIHYLGLENKPHNDVESCLKECSDTSQCTMVDYDIGTNPPCWIQTFSAAPDYNLLVWHGTNDNYILNRNCLASPPAMEEVEEYIPHSACWSKRHLIHYPGLTNSPHSDRQSCLDYCYNTPQCHIVDFDIATNPPCWAQLSAGPVYTETLRYHPTNDNYILDRICLVSLPPPPPPLPPQPADNPICWTKTRFIHYPGLTNSQFTDSSSCLNYCLSLEQCNIVDFDVATTPPCWVQTNAGPVQTETLRPHSTNHNYILNRICLESPPTIEPAEADLPESACWSKRHLIHYPGLTNMPYADRISCLKHCLSLEHCHIVDYDVATNPPCWVQTFVGPVLTETLRPHQTNDNYILNRRCLPDAWTVPTLPPPPHVALSSVNHLCWTKTHLMHYLGLTQSPFSDVNSCLEHCLNLEVCSLVDFDVATNPPCWVQTFPASFDTLYPHSTNDNYILNRLCIPAPPVAAAPVEADIPASTCWSKSHLIHYPGLTQAPFTDRNLCIGYCLQMEQCHIVDFDVAVKPSCFVQTVPGPVLTETLREHPSNDNYILDRMCLTSLPQSPNVPTPAPPPDNLEETVSPNFPDFPCWMKRLKSSYPFLVPAPFYNLDSCLRYCISLEDCYVVDYDYKTDPPCLVQSIPGPINENIITIHQSRTNYILDKRCLEPNLVPYSVELCWAWREKYHYEGLKNVPYNNLPSCLNYCASYESCFMVDYDPKVTPPCFVWEDQSPFNASKFENHDTASNFLLDRECLSYFNYSEFFNSELCWTETANSEYLGLQQTRGTTQDSCLNTCADSATCNVADFNPSDNPPCWIQTDGSAVDLNNLKPKDSVTNFVLDKTCE
ncbi:hypothetical protein HELRODRAFT_162580 [Helobdella robusta]|uniref:Apple domain-containing protein n=1 Tax=Helobdella robusta TaxID=6412 RepID=T1ESV4_HELRO|nr:hypothetical protein HELRODRAFT_162580 [Helobdella robusta]ESN99092.1 hypothetical protein HELRODRAFT_162580 [Helobdella robusta]